MSIISASDPDTMHYTVNYVPFWPYISGHLIKVSIITQSVFFPSNVFLFLKFIY